MSEVTSAHGDKTGNLPRRKNAPLPIREQNAYKRMLNFLQQKQFKQVWTLSIVLFNLSKVQFNIILVKTLQGLKAAKQILTNSKYSNHSETLAIQGLLLLGIGKFLHSSCWNLELELN